MNARSGCALGRGREMKDRPVRTRVLALVTQDVPLHAYAARFGTDGVVRIERRRRRQGASVHCTLLQDGAFGDPPHSKGEKCDPGDGHCHCRCGSLEVWRRHALIVVVAIQRQGKP